MECPHCRSGHTNERPERTELGASAFAVAGANKNSINAQARPLAACRIPFMRVADLTSFCVKWRRASVRSSICAAHPTSRSTR